MSEKTPQAIYDAIHDAWKECAISSMVLTEIVSGRQKANPEAFTFAQQKENWDRVSAKLRFALDGFSDLKEQPK